MIPVNEVEARNTISRALRTLLDLIAATRSLPRRTTARAAVRRIEPARERLYRSLQGYARQVEAERERVTLSVGVHRHGGWRADQMP
jgi:hypothetical protein